MSCLGIFFLARKEKTWSIPFFVLLLFSLIWRSFSTGDSSRYYSVLVFYGLFLSAYAINSLSRIRKNSLKTILAAANVVAILSVQLIKSFSGFNDTYILDLQEKINSISKHDDHSIVCVFERESDRLLNNTPFSKKHPELEPISEDFDISEYYVKNFLYPRDFYYVNSENKDKQLLYASVKQKMWRKIVSCNTSSTHKKNIVIYRHYVPSPDISLSVISDNLVPKAYVYEYDAFIYQDKDKIVWVVGKELDDKTEIVYQINATSRDFLPESRQKYGFDNRGFLAGKVPKETIGKYTIYKKDIPTEYPVLRIRSGFNLSSKITWTRPFSVSE